MKRILHLLILSCCFFTIKAQSPQYINYQAALRNGSGQALANQTVTLRLGIYEGAASTVKVFEETHELSTNAQGVVHCQIGKGNPVLSTTLNDIKWSKGIYNLKAEVNSGGGFIDLGTQQMVSVPYALYSQSSNYSDLSGLAENAREYTGSINPAQITAGGASKEQILRWNGKEWTPGNEYRMKPGRGISFGAGDSIHSLWTSSGINIFSNHNGNVGIGTTQPFRKLQVAGDISGNTLYSGGDYSSTGTSFGLFNYMEAKKAQTINGLFSYINLDTSNKNTRVYGVYSTVVDWANVNKIALAGFFFGNVQVSGVLSKSSGTFRIDHPQDPENKYLVHSFVESPDMMNVYNGNIITGADGKALVTLPAYFETLNRDFRYQLTVIGQPAQAWVLEEIKENQFSIQTDKPNVKVSWQVTGVRQDPWAVQHPVIPEEEKLPQDKGKYLNPEVYGKPETQGIHYHKPDTGNIKKP